MTEVKVPELGESIHTAEVLKVLVSEGDEIDVDDPVLELESDKASLEMPSPSAGKVSEIKVSEGDEIEVGQVVMTLDGADDEAESEEKAESEEASESEEESEEEPETEEESEPEEESESDEEAEEESDEADESPEARKREKKDKKERKDKKDKQKKKDREKADKKKEKADKKDKKKDKKKKDRDEAEESDADEEESDEREDRDQVPLAAAPATRRLARELGVDLQKVPVPEGSGRVRREDVTRYVREGGAGKTREPISAPEPVRKRLSATLRSAAKHLERAWREIPHVTHHELADITELENARRRIAERDGVPPLTMTAIVAKAATVVLAAYPRFNAHYDADSQEVIYHDRQALGIAVDTERGLLVPVVRDAGSRTLRSIADQIADLAEEARAGRLGAEEMRGGTFTITNVGGIGGSAFTPIIHAPQVAILGVARARVEPALRAGELVERLRLPLSLSYDHRVINGADAARFARDLARLLEDPLALLLES